MMSSILHKIVISIFLSFCFILSKHTEAQIRRDAVWCFGDSVQIDFNQSPPLLDYCATRSRGTSCSIADSLGELLFYCHTGYLPSSQAGLFADGVVWNKNHQVMENGDSIYGRMRYKEMVIVPDPGNSNRYYLFHTGVTLFNKLHYSIIDLNYNGGLGKVTQKNILVDSLSGRGLTDGLTAIKHGNGRDWWVMFRTTLTDGTSDNTIFKLLISPSGISTISTQNIGFNTYTNALNLYFNHNGNQLAIIDVLGLLELYDFNRCTGMLSNLITIHSENPSVPSQSFFWSAEFSPNDEILYVSTENPSSSFLYQFDLTSSNISASKLLIDTLVAPSIGGDLKLAADGRIYWSTGYTYNLYFPFPYADTIYNQYNMNLNVINSPDNIGTVCDFQSHSFYLGGKRTYLGLPNNPNYDMIAKGGSICDTLGLPNDIGENKMREQLQVYPNPASSSITIQHQLGNISHARIKIFDLTGRNVFEQIMNSDKIDVRSLSSGVYLLQLYVNDEFFSMNKITILD